MDGLLQIRDLGLRKEPRNESVQAETSARDLEPQRRTETSRTALNPSQPPGANQEAAAASERAGRRKGGSTTYRVLEVDAALDDLPAAPGHDGDLHPPAGGKPRQSGERERETTRTAAACGRGRGDVERSGDGTAREWTGGGGVFDPRGGEVGPRAGGGRWTHRSYVAGSAS